MVSGVYRGVAVPKATPEAKRKELSDLFAKVNNDPAYRKKMIDAGYVIDRRRLRQMRRLHGQAGKEYEAAARDVGLLEVAAHAAGLAAATADRPCMLLDTLARGAVAAQPRARRSPA